MDWAAEEAVAEVVEVAEAATAIATATATVVG
jgi:hypothetical protein